MSGRVTPKLNSSLYPPTHPGYKLDVQITKAAMHKSVPMPTGMGIIFVNGMLNGQWDKNESVVDISRSLGNRSVKGVYNDTWSVEKTTRKLSDKILEIAQDCREALEAANLTNDICLVIIAHSHGAGILERSLEDTRIAPLKRNIRIVTIGGAALIPFLGYKSATNLIHDLDFLPLLAHRDIDVKQFSTESPLWNFVVEFVSEFKKMFQEDVLKLTSHKKPALADRIWSGMQSSITPSTVNNLYQDIVKAGNKHLNSQKVTDQNVAQAACDILSVMIAHMTYKIEISKIPMQPMNTFNQYFDIFHSVQSYIPQLSPLVMGYIQDYERKIAFKI